MSDALTAKLRALSDPRACQDNEFGASVACAEALAEIVALRSRVADLEADIASRSGTWTRCRCGGTFRAPKQVGMSVPEHTCPGCRRAEAAEDRVEKLEAVERAAREYRRRERTGGGCDVETTERLACAVEDARRVLDAALAAAEVQRG